MKAFSVLWIVPEERGGIRSYSETLWPAVKKAWSGDGIDPIFRIPSIEELERLNPDIIHVQHEFGLFGGKIPGKYFFPRWVRGVRKALPRIKIVATAHMVIPADYRFPTRGRSWQTPIRWLANHGPLQLMRPLWLQGTWGKLSGAIVHSELQRSVLLESGCTHVEVIPHFVPVKIGADETTAPKEREGQKTVLVFGFFTPDKAQDVVIEAMAKTHSNARLVLAGGLRREEDRGYLEFCERRIRELGLQNRVQITGFLAEGDIDRYYKDSDLVVAPFRDTSGSGSLAHAFARGAAILASDLPLNREVERRQSGCMSFFKTENPDDCAKKIDLLLNDSQARLSLSQNALKYAEANSVQRIAEKHVLFYRRF